ncbi:MAG: M3 family oligoendopeptidase, partial [Bacteroidota bacterium]
MRATALPHPKGRRYLPSRFELTAWEYLCPFYEELLDRPITTLQTLEKWLCDRSELDAFISESFAWRYINISSDSANEEAQADYQY